MLAGVLNVAPADLIRETHDKHDRPLSAQQKELLELTFALSDEALLFLLKSARAQIDDQDR